MKFTNPFFLFTRIVEIEMSVKSFRQLASLAKDIRKGDTIQVKGTNPGKIVFIFKK